MNFLKRNPDAKMHDNAKPDLEMPEACRAAVNGHQRLIEDLFREHNKALVGFLRMRLPTEQDARDVAQEAYVKLLQLDKPEELSFLKAYLYKIAANLAIDHLRRQQTRDRGAKETALFDLTAPANQEQSASGRQELEIVKQAVSELPPKCRQAFLLSRNGWSSSRIGLHMALSDRTIRNYLRRSLEHLELRLQQEHGERE